MSKPSPKSNEVWLPIVGYEGIYEVSSAGNVRSIDRCITYPSGRTLRWRGKVLSQSGGSGYRRVILVKDGIERTHLVHRIVAEAFLPNEDNLPCVDHLNCDRFDNRVDNLKWCSVSENVNNPITHSRMVSAKTNPIIQLTLDGVLVGTFNSIHEASRETGICCTSISRACFGRQKTAGGYKWKYQNQSTE